jgi:lysophospholipase L1-like esterase
MFGDSLTYEGDWNHLLCRDDTINAGVSGEGTHAMLYRLDTINLEQVTTVCIMAGINDIFLYGESADTVFDRYEMIVAHFNRHHLHVMVQSTLYVTEAIAEYSTINREVDRLNHYLKSYNFIDINTHLSDTRALKQHYSSDGVHLSADAYRIWAEQLLNRDARMLK